MDLKKLRSLHIALPIGSMLFIMFIGVAEKEQKLKNSVDITSILCGGCWYHTVQCFNHVVK